MTTTVYVFEEDAVAPSSIVDGKGIGTNRNATGPILVTIESSGPGTRYDFHCVADQDFSIYFPSFPGGGQDLFADGSGAAGNVVTLHAVGATLTAWHTAPGLWTGVVQGPATIA
jgi:hypothetical protein